MDAIAPWHIIVVAVVAIVLFFGWKQLPDMSRSLGRSLRIFKTEMKGMTADAAQPAPAATVAPVAAEPVAQAAQSAQPVSVVESVRPVPVATVGNDR